jgi:thiol:disulfide interchange protein DsbD
MKQRILFIALCLLSLLTVTAQKLTPITWDVTVENNTNESATLKFAAHIEKGWHLYGFNLPEGGPNSTAINLDLPEGVTAGTLQPSHNPIEKFDQIFSLKLAWWDSDVTFTQSLNIADGMVHEISATIFFQGCNDQTCISPQKQSFTVKVGTGTLAETMPTPTETTEVPENATNATTSTSTHTDWWAPIEFDDDNANGNAPTDSSLWWIFLWGFGGGLIALLTPCVWPMIPMTVSFFLKKSGNRKKSIIDASIYGVSIIVIYLALGLAITMIFGAGKLNDLSTNAWFNIAFFLLLLLFAISFLGGFDITLPSKWSNSVDAKAERATGLISIFFMAFTLALVSFSCTGPIIGTLLVEAATMGHLVGPAVGMGGFALALALPFSLFAIFPTWLKGMPRSGGWLNSVKVVLGFLELALSLKFLSVADLAYGWGILDREVFLCLWIVIFAMLGAYLIGKIQFSHDSPISHVSIPRFFLSTASFAFAIYLIPGLWGAPLKSISAFAPPLYTQDFNLYDGGEFEEFDDYDAGMQFAADNHRPVLIDFSGYGCVNCRKMEGAVFDTPVVTSLINDNFVLIKLMVDDKTALKTPITVEENGHNIKLETVGEKWSYLQRSKFGANSQPYYIVLDNNGKALVAPTFYDENVNTFVDWLNKALENYHK